MSTTQEWHYIQHRNGNVNNMKQRNGTTYSTGMTMQTTQSTGTALSTIYNIGIWPKSGLPAAQLIDSEYQNAPLITGDLTMSTAIISFLCYIK